MSNLSTANSLFKNSTIADNYNNYYNHYNDGYFDWHTESVLPTILYLTLFDVAAFWGIIGNVMILVIMRHQSLSSFSYSVFLRFLAATDLVVIVMLLTEVNLDRFDLFQHMVTWNVRFCQIYTFLQHWSMCLSLWLLVAITCDRFIAVAFPLKWKMSSTKSKAFITCMTFALLTLLFNLSVFYTVDTVSDEHDSSILYCSFRTDIRIIADSVTFVFGSVLPIVLIFLLNMLTLYQIRLSRRHRDHLSEGNKNASEKGDETGAEPEGRLGARSHRNRRFVEPEDSFSEGTVSMSTETEGISIGSIHAKRLSVHVSDINTRVDVSAHDKGRPLHANLKHKKYISNVSPEATNEPPCPIDDKVEDLQKSTTKYPETSNIRFNVRIENTDNVGKNESSLSATNPNTNETDENESKFPEQTPQSNQKRNNVQTRNYIKGSKTPKRIKRLDRATVSLTYISVSALLTMTPYGVMHGLFMVFLDQWDALLVHDPWAPVPLHLQNLIRVWDVLELVMLFNFCQNFYILLLTNDLVYRALRNTLGNHDSHPLSKSTIN